MTEPLFRKGDRVSLLRATIGMADDAELEVILPEGSIGEVVGVRECGNPDGPQGPWLYDVDFQVDVHGKLDLVWGIYDATDAADLNLISRKG